MAEGEDLYDDLYEDVGDTLFFKAPFHENDSREEEFKKKEVELNGKVESLLKEVEALQQDKVVLTRNISCLFKTAQMELARKDKQMKELRDENLKLKLGGTRDPTNVRPHLTKAVPADKTNVGMDSSEQGNRCNRLDPSEGAGVSARTHEPDSDRPKESSDEGKKDRSPSRGSLNCSNQHKDSNPDSSRRPADDSSNRQRSSSFNNSGSDRRREMRHAEHGRTEHRSRDRGRDSSRDRSRDHRDGSELRHSESRKRHRS